MGDELLQYYNRELAYLRRQGAEFAEAYPRVAGHLRMSEESVEDPHVSRLLEGVAFLSAQIRQRLDGHFTELADVLMGTLYPDYQAPIPSMSILQMTPAPALKSIAPLEQDVAFETVSREHPKCRFEGRGEQAVGPIEVIGGAFENSPFEAPRHPRVAGARSIIRLRLQARTSFQDLDPQWLRFYLHGQSHQSHELYDLIHRTGLGCAMVPVDDQRQVRFFPGDALRPVGFDDDEALVPWGQRGFTGYRLLTEYFLFPEKFLFVQLDGLAGQWPETREVDLYFYLGEGNEEQEKRFVADHMRLWCTPVVNLFSDRLEPVRSDEGEYRHRLAPRYGDSDVSEVVDLERVDLLRDGKALELAPYYGRGHPKWQNTMNVYWHLHREQAEWAGGRNEPGTEAWLSLVDHRCVEQGRESLPRDETLAVRARCCNRNLPASLPFGGGSPRFRAVDESRVERAEAIVAPTETVRPELGNAGRWQFVQHLTLAHFDGPDALERLRTVLQLHDFRKTPETRALIDGIEDVAIKPSVARVGTGVQRGVCRGSDVVITFSRPSYAGTSIYLFAAVLDRFFAHFAQLNSFTRLRVRLSGQNQDYHVWPARAGEQTLL